MGQKSNPIGLRLQINRTWDSRWFAEGADYGRMLLEDINIRKFVMKTLPQAAIFSHIIRTTRLLTAANSVLRASAGHSSSLPFILTLLS